MSDPYMKAGRGGAGNFYTKQDLKDLEDAAKAEALNDIEAQNQSGAAVADTANDLTRTYTSSTAPSPYLHTGRGGAGNWVEPSVLHAQGLSQEATPNPTSTHAHLFGTTKRAVGQSKPTYRGGRGGAGNYVDFEAEERERREEEERVRADVERQVERDVEAGLARPPRAYGGPGAWEMVDMK